MVVVVGGGGGDFTPNPHHVRPPLSEPVLYSCRDINCAILFRSVLLLDPCDLTFSSRGITVLLPNPDIESLIHTGNRD